MTTSSLPQHTISGSGDTTVFLLHGAYGDGRYFANTAAVLADSGYRVVVWNCPGYGTSALPDDSSIPAHAVAAAELVRAVGTDHNIVLGHSMGALIAPLAAVNEPQIHALILSAGSAGFVSRTPEDQKRYMVERLEPIEKGMTVAEYVRPLIAHMMAPGAHGPLVDRVAEVILSMRTETFVASIKAISKYDSRPALQKVPVPTLLIAGEHDTACPPAGMAKMAELIPEAQLHVIDGVGHYGFAERPDEYHRLVLRFLRDRIDA